MAEPTTSSPMSQSEQVEQFRAVTGAEEDVARQILQRAGWNLEMGVTLFFDDPNGSDPVGPPPPAVPAADVGPIIDLDEEESVEREIDYIDVTMFDKANPALKAILTGLHIEAKVTGYVAEVRVSHKFVNRNDTPLEALFTLQQFDVAVSSFSVKIGERTVHSMCMEKDRAEARYDDAIASGHGGYMLNQQGSSSDLFTLSVGNMPPAQTAIITLVYYTALTTEGDATKLTIPITKVFIPNSSEDVISSSVSSSEGGATTTTTTMEHDGLSVVVRAHTSSPVVGVQCDTHQVSHKLGEENGDVTVTLLPDQGTLQREFTLLIGQQDVHRPSAIMETYVPPHHADDDDDGNKKEKDITQQQATEDHAIMLNI
eukprot:TRINITY_DN382_c0_g3_i2.p1 TRINITY_DN382_c0_g3~~TRINITY_DN382_c0_g3_i2.p1  ORF type:complete len:371 (-),score=107.97 TRINITY_DN382_c0_g3_i2:8-1120(-)